MSIQTEVTRIKSATVDIRSKYVELGIAQSTDKIDALATASQQIENQGAVTATVPEGSTYTIPKGYHNGSGTVTGIAPAADATVETWETPDMTSENTPAPYEVSGSGEIDGHYCWMAFDGNANTYWASNAMTGSNSHSISLTLPGNAMITGVRLTPASGDETVNFPSVVRVAINDAEDPVDGQSFSLSEPVAGVGQEVTFDPVVGNYIELTFDEDEEYRNRPIAIAEIEIRTKESVSKYSLQSTKIVTPTSQQQNVTPDSGYYGLSSVTVNPIPGSYKDVSIVTANAEDVLTGKIIVGSDGQMVAGTMTNNGDISLEIDGLTVTEVTIPAGYTEGGTVSLSSDIEEMLATI